MSNPKPANSPTLSTTDRHARLTLFLAFVVSAAVLTLVLPRAENVGFFYNVGEPWHYPSLYAPEQFPVYKAEAELEAERNKVTSNVQPYFTLDNNVAERQRTAFLADYAAGKFEGLPAAYANHIAEALTEVYEHGVMSMADADSLAKFAPVAVHIVSGKEAQSRAMVDVYSIRTAYEAVMEADTATYHRDVMTAADLQNYLLPNIVLDRKKTVIAVDEAMAAISETHGMVKKGEKIIDRGELVSEEKAKILDSYQRDLTQRGEDGDRGLWELLLGQALFVILILAAETLYLYFFRPSILRSSTSVLLLFTLITVFPLTAHLLLIFKTLNPYIVPFALVAVFVRVFFDARTAFSTLLFTLLLASIGTSAPYEFLFIETAAGLAAIFSVSELTERSQLLRVTLIITLVSLTAALVFDLSQGTGLSGLNRTHYIYIAVSGLLMLSSYPLLYLLERLFGLSSTMTMLELMNINHPLLSRLSQTAQGTWSHSMQVANLATDVAKKIGARVQLVRTGAFYHDIGKMENPAYFTENQTGVNPHDTLANEKQSAKIIISHVTEGLRLASEHNLPKEVCDFIRTHHGRGRVRYFYIQWKNNHPGEQLDESAFTYPGPNPMTKEQAVLMLCDAVEAASRSLPEYTAESISALVTRIVDGIVDEGCLRRCPISFLDIEVAKRTLVESLKRIYHTRIAYPELKNKEA
ncbi:MAG: HDIG domain-containing protein [Bacteroidaceae bacterium]|nr:HDIG domain-containing protein [Bacteroidaceae bacterium]